MKTTFSILDQISSFILKQIPSLLKILNSSSDVDSQEMLDKNSLCPAKGLKENPWMNFFVLKLFPSKGNAWV